MIGERKFAYDVWGAKNKGVVKMYYLDRIKPEFSKDEEGLMPNGKFWEMYG